MMNNIQDLWNKRVKEYWNMAIRYLRLIGNSGFLFAIYIAIVVGSYYYSELLKWLPSSFPAAIFLAVVTAFLLTKSPIRTFLKEGDLVFLSPIEGKLKAYFQASFFYTLLLQTFTIVLVIVLLTPMYRFFITDNGYSLLFVITVLFISKAWNLHASWEEGRLLYESTKNNHKVGRFFVNLTLTYLLFSGAAFYLLVAIFAIKGMLSIVYYSQIQKQHSLKWEFLIDQEERMVMSFYRVANMFTDVPKLSTKVKKRSMISSLANLLSFKQGSTFKYLYLKSFIRANDYFGVYLRLLIIGIIFLFYVQLPLGKVFVALLLLYMSALQLSTLANHHQLKIWVDLYPIDATIPKKSFSLIVFSLLLVKTSIFTIFIFFVTGLLVETFLLVGIGIGFSYVYSYYLLHRKVVNG